LDHAPLPSPRITESSWGRLDVEGLGAFKDAKLWPGGGRAWDWRETGTGHVPGVQVADAEELLEHGAEVVVLSRGMLRVLRCPEATVAALEARGVTVHVAPTPAAIEEYNRLAAAGARVGGLFHSTC
jgi:hypothetical protein